MNAALPPSDRGSCLRLIFFLVSFSQDPLWFLPSLICTCPFPLYLSLSHTLVHTHALKRQNNAPRCFACSSSSSSSFSFPPSSSLSVPPHHKNQSPTSLHLHLNPPLLPLLPLLHYPPSLLLLPQPTRLRRLLPLIPPPPEELRHFHKGQHGGDLDQSPYYAH